MWRTISVFALTGVFCVGLNLKNSDAVAQTTEPEEAVEVTEPAPPAWKPQDGRPPWSSQQELDTELPVDWRPGDGKPPWAASPEAVSDQEPPASKPEWAGRPEWADRPDDPHGLASQRRIDAQSLQSARGGVASSTQGRGRGRGRH